MANTPSFFKKYFVPRSLFGRSLLILIIPVLLIQIITSIVFFERHWKKVTNRLAFAVSGEISLMADAIEKNPEPENIQRITGYALQRLELLINYEPGAELDMSAYIPETSPSLWEFMVQRTLERHLEEGLQRPFVIFTDFNEKWVQVNVQLEGGLMSISMPERRLFSSSSYIFLLWMIAVSFFLLFISVLFMRGQVRPIRRLAIAMDRFGKGRDVPDFKPEGAKEVRQAGEAFLNMQRRITRQVEQRTLMLAGVSHDLRTPLTRLKLALSMASQDCEDARAMKDDIADMERMIAGYLDFVRGDGDEDFEAVKINHLIEKIADKQRLADKKIHLDLAEISLDVQPLAFERCLVNLTGNALRYAGSVWISLRQEDERIIILIEDDGPGIPEDQYEEVFKPFKRIDDSRNSETGGVGLGLPIAMDIVHAHGGSIALDESAHGGLAVIIRLPV